MVKMVEKSEDLEEKASKTLKNSETRFSAQRFELEAKINQLETQNKLITNENERLLENNKLFSNKIEEIKGEYKTLEYKMKILTSDESLNVEEFIRKVSKKEKNYSLETQEFPEKNRFYKEISKEKNITLLDSLNKEYFY